MRVRRSTDGKGSASGQIQRCGNAWACPRCRRAIMAERRRVLGEFVRWHAGEALENADAPAWQEGAFDGRRVYHLTLTMRHTRGERPRNAPSTWEADRLRQSVARIADAWRQMTRGAWWTRLRRESGWVACRFLEVTRGRHGWHPHYHVIVGTQRPLSPEIQAEIERRWIEAVDASRASAAVVGGTVAGLAAKWREFHPARDRESLEKVVHYVTKEVTDADGKEGRHGSESPYEWLRGDHSQKREYLWKSYAIGMRGARLSTFPRKFLRAAGIDDLADEVAAALEIEHEAGAVEVGQMDAPAWAAWTAIGLVSVLLDRMAGPDAEWIPWWGSMPEHMRAGVYRYTGPPNIPHT